MIQINGLIRWGLWLYHTNQIGTPQEMTNKSGVIVWQADLKAYGGVQHFYKQDTPNNIRFQGQYFDEEIGLHCNATFCIVTGCAMISCNF